LRQEKAEAKQARIAKLRPVFLRMFELSGEIKSYSTMQTAEKVFANDKSWKEAELDERAMILGEYTTDLRLTEEVSPFLFHMMPY
jgi:pre-mRNA-processing factor 40